MKLQHPDSIDLSLPQPGAWYPIVGIFATNFYYRNFTFNTNINHMSWTQWRQCYVGYKKVLSLHCHRHISITVIFFVFDNSWEPIFLTPTLSVSLPPNKKNLRFVFVNYFVKKSTYLIILFVILPMLLNREKN